GRARGAGGLRGAAPGQAARRWPAGAAVIQGPPIPPGFDPNFFFTQAAPTVGLVAVILVGALGLRWLFGTVVGEALAERIRQGSRRRRHWKGFGGEWLAVAGGTPGESGPGAARDAHVTA